MDVRSFPQSRFEHFKREHLEKTLKDAGIGYVYLGKELGGFRKGGYLAYTETIAYQGGISHLEDIDKEGVTAFLCAERLPWKCHRRFIAASLEESEWQVLHIIDKGRVWIPTRNRSERVDKMGNNYMCSEQKHPPLPYTHSHNTIRAQKY